MDAANEIIDQIFEDAREHAQAALVADELRELFAAGKWDPESLARTIESIAEAVT